MTICYGCNRFTADAWRVYVGTEPAWLCPPCGAEQEEFDELRDDRDEDL